MTSLKVTIANVSEQLFDGDAKSVIVPSSQGQMQVLANHESFIGTLKTGTIILELENSDKQKFDIDGGVIEVSDSHATILLQSKV